MNTLWAMCPLCGPRAAFLKAADFVCLFISLFIYYCQHFIVLVDFAFNMQ